MLRRFSLIALFILVGPLAACGGGGGGADGAGASLSDPPSGVNDATVTDSGTTVPLNRVIEQSVTNTKNYSNKFTDVTLNVEYTSPSRRTIRFFGFYDGDGAGGQAGTVWKMRFMPNELGEWRYKYSWSDGTAGAEGAFTAVAAAAGPGVLRAYKNNRRWFAYNGTDPVFLKSYYVGPSGFTGAPIDWAVQNVYSRIASRGYNHVQLKALPIAWSDETPSDTPNHLSRPLWRESVKVQNLDVWQRFEEHMAWLNDKNISVHFFMGFDPKPDRTSNMAFFSLKRWTSLSSGDQDFYVRYVAARLAPFANIAGWNYTWETDGNSGERRLMELLKKYDPWQHLATYHDEYPASNDYGDAMYGFAGIENHGYFGNHGGAPALDSASHYQATIDAYRNKPVYMVEGNGLWHAWWAKAAADPSITRAAWAVTLAGGSFAWQDTQSPEAPASSMFGWPASTPMVDRVDVLYRTLTQDVVFHRMNPHNELLSGCWNKFDRNGSVPTSPCYALAEPGKQYLVYKEDGGRFALNLAGGTYAATWIDTRTGARQPANGGSVNGGGSVQFAAPNATTDWVLLLAGA